MKMADLSTSFMGIRMTSPVVVGASLLSNRIDNIKRAEEAGAGGLVVYSLFQEQIELETKEVDEEIEIGAERFAESLTYFPHMEHAGPREHIMWIERTRKEVNFPLFGSLNATSKGKWIEYAKQLESAGCNGLELNLYSLETDPNKPGEEIEKQSLEVVSEVKSSVSIPVAVKLSPWYTSVANFAKKVVEVGADGIVMFNRFYQPIINPETESPEIRLELSTPAESRLPMRWIAILSDVLDVDIAESTGVHTGLDVARQILVGARAVQTVSALYENGIDHISVMNRELSEWMDSKGYADIDAFRGKLSQKNVADPYAFERAQYIEILMRTHEHKTAPGIAPSI